MRIGAIHNTTDLVLNTSSMGVKQAVEVIIAATRHQEIKQAWALWPQFSIPAKRLREFLDRHNVRYVNITHSAAYTAQEVAESTHITGASISENGHHYNQWPNGDGRSACTR